MELEFGYWGSGCIISSLTFFAKLGLISVDGIAWYRFQVNIRFRHVGNTGPRSFSLARCCYVYNMLRQLPTDCPTIPILEHLCDLLGPVVSSSKHRPAAKFHDRLELFYGATIVKVETEGTEHRVLFSSKKIKTCRVYSNDANIHF
jgi:hypothetical protein